MGLAPARHRIIPGRVAACGWPLLACRAMRIAREVPQGWIVSALVLALAAGPVRLPAAAGSPVEYLPVGDPIESELRTLDILGPEPDRPALHLPHLGMRPLARFEADSLP